MSGAADIFLSHGHLDHCLGVPFVLSHRTLHELQATRVFCPQEIVEPVRRLIEAGEALEGVAYEYELIGAKEGDWVDVGSDLRIECFETSHVVPSLGFTLHRRHRRLAEAYRGLSGGEIARLRADGAEVSEVSETPWVAYCGDTRAALFEARPSLYLVPVLVIECTFLGAGMRERGERYGHIHLEDLADRAELFQNEALVLHHLSRRYRTSELRRQVDEQLGDLAGRVVIVGERKPQGE